MSDIKKESFERAVLVGLSSPGLPKAENATEDTLLELEELLKTAGGVALGSVMQRRHSPDPHTFIGEGKIAEIRDFAEQNDANLIVFDNNISPSQTRALEKALDMRVIDRSALILDIFAKRARTSEGQLQVELAQYQYLLPRLSGMWGHLVRQTASGGRSPIGTRGPGETQLETDRRHIREKIARLKDTLSDVRRVRANQRRKREKADIPLIAIVGYTNVGKSTLLNTLTGSDIPANNRLFDTLDPTTRAMPLKDNRPVLVSDTVGFIHKLPHGLISAFKATLEELSFADLVLHVIDGANAEWPMQAEVADRLITELCPPDVPRLRVFNKTDLCGTGDLPTGEDVVWISAATGEGLPALLAKIENRLAVARHEATLLFPYGEGALLDSLYREATVRSVDYGEDGIHVRAVCETAVLSKYQKYRDTKDKDHAGQI